MLCCNLKDPKNTELRGKIKSGAIPPEVLVTLGERDLINPERRKKLDEEFEIRAKDTNLKEIANSKRQSSQLFQCPRCKVRDCSFYQMQTRSADEPMTTFCECNKCGQHWKKY
ncbi:transcription elongation factor S-II [Angomonas deanei]|uniref:Transcription factor S-II (TFIIS), central domain/Transcription factor S-II (TFIIS), putative n=1 Tax=Angomonas deanei TaxID=59799 RepID=A0A7G2CJD2_9TRYP|nr:transcription elongation factor S-II [Angomonas deanei]CAD2219968.1 Transcription factor S-II (TFIIS), central domain/Transcription factor S-II (TFIIS), putative [Angomonas deanei]|eukprot:EPY34562.1 transcription elongation factor S-II [Angomonas deanei]